MDYGQSHQSGTGIHRNPDAWIHHNVFYHRAEVPFVRARMDDGTYTAEENEFYQI